MVIVGPPVLTNMFTKVHCKVKGYLIQVHKSKR